LWVFFQILVLIFTDVCGKSLREKNDDAHKGIQNVTIGIVIKILYRNTPNIHQVNLFHDQVIHQVKFIARSGDTSEKSIS